MNTSIRLMNRDDKNAVLRIIHKIPEFTPSEMSVAEELIDCYLDDPLYSGYYILVATTDKTVVGYICFGQTPITDGTWDIYWMAVEPSLQSHGIGRSLITHAEHEIKNSKGRLVIIETSSKPEYEKTRRFHLSQGYETSCRITDFYAPGDDKIILLKKL